MRLTAFPAAPIVLDEAEWWEQVTNEKPQNTSIDRTTGLIQFGTVPGEAGLGADLRLVVNPVRVQWDLVPTEPTSPREVRTLGHWHQAAPPFSELMRRWLSMAPALNRIAFGAVLMGPVNDSSEGYARLSEFLPYEIDPASSDFLFQTNKRVASAAHDSLELNRLSKWSVAQVQVVTLSTGAGPAVGHHETILTACRLELDINTAAERTEPLRGDLIPSLWNELLDIGRAISDHGIRNWE
jgi:hypothetical protein